MKDRKTRGRKRLSFWVKTNPQSRRVLKARPPFAAGVTCHLNDRGEPTITLDGPWMMSKWTGQEDWRRMFACV